MVELDPEVGKLVEIQNKVYEWRQTHYDHPTVQPGFDRLTAALAHLSKAIDLICKPMG